MRFGLLIWRNLTFHRAANAAVLAGVAVAASALTGALIVGDSVRGTLRAQALNRTAGASYAITAGDYFFRTALSSVDHSAAPVLLLPAAVQNASGKARANTAQVIGIDERYFSLGGSSKTPSWNADSVLLSRALADQLHTAPGDEIVLRIERPGMLAGEAALNPGKNSTLGWRVRVTGLLEAGEGGNLNLRGSGAEAFNVFLPITALGRQSGLEGKANILLVGADTFANGLGEELQKHWTLEDAGLEVASLPGGALEIRSPRVFMDDTVLRTAQTITANVVPILTYLVNLVEHGTNVTPYSMVTGADTPYTPTGMRDDEILLSPWLAEDLQAHVGDTVLLSYFLPDSGAGLNEATNSFRVVGIAASDPLRQDQTLMPQFPGIEEAERAHDWDAGFPLKYNIRDKDEDYWRQYRGTPKAFITVAAAQRIWENRFGNLTSIRVLDTGLSADRLESSLLSNMTPAQVGFSIASVRSEALAAADKSQDFGQLFLAFSIFIIFSALLLIILLFQFGLESRSAEAGTLIAAGFSLRRLRRVYMLEALVVSLAGSATGVVLGVLYAKALLWALATLWSAAVGGIALQLHLNASTLLVGGLASLVISVLSAWLVVRARSRRVTSELLSGELEVLSVTRAARFSLAAAVVPLLAALALGGWSLWKSEIDPAAFFGVGWLLLIAGWALFWHWLRRRHHNADAFTFRKLMLRSPARAPRRSLAVVALLSAGCFVLVAVSAFRLGAPEDRLSKESGTGGFNLIASANLPIQHDLTTTSGRKAVGLESLSEDTVIVPFRVKEGDEASCLNLNRASRPRLLGVNPERLKGRFKLSQVAKGFDAEEGWELLRRAIPAENGQIVIPAIGDANSVRWSMGKRLGESIDLMDELGHVFQVKIVATVANSIWQGSLVIDESAFLKAFPRASGYRFFLVDTPEGQLDPVSEKLSDTLEDFGCEAVPAARRLAAFNAVQNTYLSTFQILGGIGLLLGSAGLGILVMRNVLERRVELAVMLAAGFRKSQLVRLAIDEHALLLAAGLVIGTAAAFAAIIPALGQRDLGWGALLSALCIVLCNGLLWTWAATRVALRGSLLETLRNE